MAGTLKLEKEAFDNSAGLLIKCCNTDVLEAVQGLGRLMSDTGDDNPLVQETLQACINFENTYNSYKETVDEGLHNMGETYAVAEWLEKATVGEVTKQDLAVSGQKMDASQLIQ